MWQSEDLRPGLSVLVLVLGSFGTESPALGETRAEERVRKWEEGQVQAIRAALTPHRKHRDPLNNVPPESQWFLLLLREQNVQGYADSTSYNIQAKRTVQYVKLQGPDAAARKIFEHLRGTRPYYERDFIVHCFATESEAEYHRALNMSAAQAAGAKSSSSGAP